MKAQAVTSILLFGDGVQSCGSYKVCGPWACCGGCFTAQFSGKNKCLFEVQVAILHLLDGPWVGGWCGEEGGWERNQVLPRVQCGVELGGQFCWYLAYRFCGVPLVIVFGSSKCAGFLKRSLSGISFSSAALVSEQDVSSGEGESSVLFVVQLARFCLGRLLLMLLVWLVTDPELQVSIAFVGVTGTDFDICTLGHADHR